MADRPRRTAPHLSSIAERVHAGQRFTTAPASVAVANTSLNSSEEGLPIPAYFCDASEAVHYAQEHKLALYWKGTTPLRKAAARTGRPLRGAARFTRKGAAYVGLVSLDEQKNAEKNP